MATYIVGDVQGCFDELEELLRVVDFQPASDQIFFVGDLVNRGPSSLMVLRWIYSHQHCAFTVLGNHDLFLLACWLGYAVVKQGDTLEEVLSADDATVLLNWLIEQPLVRVVDNLVIAHAGIAPGWKLSKAVCLAERARLQYSGAERNLWFTHMFGNKPTEWSKELSEFEKFRFTINAFTRMRFCDGNCLDFKYKGEISNAPDGFIPWFDSSDHQVQQTIVFGHWSALGLKVTPRYIALDTGCIWGGALTAYCVESKQIISVPAKRAYQKIDGN
ncbi:symmetrical bis(5'-nucleosyl)-tetraphosphatase [Chitinibacter fontanus]|uniref:bis(5'-nucleosyl)-tetraphosphatase (symmetrical) n=1 Tax=Chitinibacter fontanus TaxID=1737446 RepID=A0A7D5Z4B3_9NEIS|nr:symmetrical bis(5'-nucleosyl)-tetraphosphatase [Chitinibacter fontanus]QLI81941.1 symmetrical bis(5'-nucleosyl)-tetraphosphatase [Chitinibacter fontanus]